MANTKILQFDKTISFMLNEELHQKIERLTEVFGVKSKGEVLRILIESYPE